MDHYLMACGHAANATDKDGNPVCVICIGIDPGATVIKEDVPDLTDRKARCYCGKKVDSKLSLPFFSYRPEKEFDEYYCGCQGWD